MAENENLKIEYIPVDKLKPYERNARKHADIDVDAIAASIQAFGFRDPIGVWGKNNVIVEGHGRLMAAKKLGMDSVPCIRLDDMTDEQRRGYALAHNKTAELSSWDFDTLNTEIEELSESFDFDNLGFDTIFPQIYSGDDKEEPDATFDEIDQPIKAKHVCPKCGYEWN